jgi:CDP-paratose 2-epimerase
VNLLGTASLLEALRNASSPVPIVFASTNKVYGGLDDVPLTQANGAYVPCDPVCRSEGFDETRALEFHTPYGCSKGAADQYVLDYARSFSLPTAVLRMSCIYGPRQLGTEDQGWVAHFLLRALAGEPIVVYGDGKQVRDVLHVDDAVSAYIAVWRNIARVRGRAFNLGGGPRNAISLLQLLRYIGKLTGRPPQVRFADWRPNDQRYYVSNTGRIRETLHLAEPIGWQEGVAGLLKHFMESGGARRVPHLARAVPA